MLKYAFPKNQENFFTHNNHFDYPHLHTHSYWEIHIFIKGSATHHFNGKKYPIEPNTLWIIHPEDQHCITDGSPDLSYINFGISLKAMELFTFSQSNIFKQALQQSILCFPISQITTQKLLADETALLLLDKSSPEFKFGLYKQFLNILSNVTNLIHLIPLNKKTHLDQDVASVMNKLKDRNNMNRSLTEILSECPYCYGGIAKKFKQQLKISPSEFFIQCKMETAKNLLESSFESIENIATIVGYSSITCFHNTFKKHYATTPGAYRKKWRNDYSPYEYV